MDHNLVAELRKEFLAGATPSKLMSLIVAHQGESDHLHRSIADYFKEAFGVPLLRLGSSEGDYSPQVRHAHFNRVVLPEMIQRLADWNTANLEGSWLNGLAVHTLQEHREQLHSARVEELARIWTDLSEKEQRFVVQQVTKLNYDWELMKALAALAERLQQKVVELEAELKRERSAPSVPHSVAPPKPAWTETA